MVVWEKGPWNFDVRVRWMLVSCTTPWTVWNWRLLQQRTSTATEESGCKMISHFQTTFLITRKYFNCSWYQIFAVFWMLYAFFWVVIRRRHKKIQTSGNYPQENIQHFKCFLFCKLLAITYCEFCFIKRCCEYISYKVSIISGQIYRIIFVEW